MDTSCRIAIVIQQMLAMKTVTSRQVCSLCHIPYQFTVDGRSISFPHCKDSILFDHLYILHPEDFEGFRCPMQCQSKAMGDVQEFAVHLLMHHLKYDPECLGPLLSSDSIKMLM